MSPPSTPGLRLGFAPTPLHLGLVVGFDSQEEGKNLMPGLNGRRVAVITGVRTPFAKAGTSLKDARAVRSEEHTSELQSQSNLVCRLLLEKKKQHHSIN